MLLAAVVVAALVWILVRRSRSRAWDARFAAAIEEARWVTTVVAVSLVNPTLSTDAMTLYWNESQPRIQRLQDELAALSTAKPDPTRRAKVDRLARDLESLHQSMSTLVAVRAAAADSPAGDVSLQQARTTVQERSRNLQEGIGDRTAPPAPA